MVYFNSDILSQIMPHTAVLCQMYLRCAFPVGSCTVVSYPCSNSNSNVLSQLLLPDMRLPRKTVLLVILICVAFLTPFFMPGHSLASSPTIWVSMSTCMSTSAPHKAQYSYQVCRVSNLSGVRVPPYNQGAQYLYES